MIFSDQEIFTDEIESQYIGEERLSSGIEMPQVGFGVFQIVDEQQCERAVTQALHAGYLSIDTATAYQNEVAVGRAIKNSGIRR
ncbi:hypothetical protein WP50_21275, partial [Lactiplantibacillus plantarum]